MQGTLAHDREEKNSMTKNEINKRIVTEIREEIARKGLTGKLDVYPVENTFTRRPRFWNDGNVNLFKVHMWNLNLLEGEDLSNEIEARVIQATKYFGLNNI